MPRLLRGASEWVVLPYGHAPALAGGFQLYARGITWPIATQMEILLTVRRICLPKGSSLQKKIPPRPLRWGDGTMLPFP